jgi:NADH-quinone oxidoreductase subunit N
MISLFYALISAIAAMFVLNSVARILENKKIELAISLIFTSLISAVIALMLSEGYFGIHAQFIKLNEFSLLLSLAVSLGMILIHLISFREKEYTDFSVLSMFSFIGMLLVIMSNSIVTIFIGLALLTVPTVFSLFLNSKWVEAGVKYFIVTALSAGLFAFGAAMLFASSGSLQITGQSYDIGNFIAFLFLFASIAVESGIFPFNLWIPDVYQKSPAFITSMLGGLNKKIGLIALIFVLLIIFPYASKGMLAIFSILTMFYGNIAALVQKNVKRMLAYSSISQVGYILIGLSTLSNYGIASSIYQIFSHMFAFIGLFAIVMLMEAQGRHEISDYVGLNKENKIAAFIVAIMLLSMIGMPFTAGFIGKFMLFSSAVASNMAWLAIIGIINTVISVYYYAKLIIAVYTNKADARPIIISSSLATAAVISLVIVLILGIYPSILFGLAQSAASAI